MIYLKLCLNQDQEWSHVTISSLAKMLVGVNNIVVENLEFSANFITHIKCNFFLSPCCIYFENLRVSPGRM